MSTRLVLLGLLWLGPACSVTALAERERSTAANECAADDECGGGSCRDGACTAAGGELESFLFELVPSGISGIGGRSFWSFQRLTPGEGVDFHGFGRLTGRIKVELAEGCEDVAFRGFHLGGPVRVADDGTIPARLTLSPAKTLGLSSESFSVTGDTSDFEVSGTLVGGPATIELAVDVPIGFYDMYVQPAPIHEQASPEDQRRCSLPPQLLLSQTLAQSAETVLDLLMPEPAALKIDLRYPSNQSFGGWQLDMVDGQSGLPISTAVTIPAGGADRHEATLLYYPVATSGAGEPDSRGEELLRLSPPPRAVAATFLFERAALELFERGSAVLAPVESLLPPVEVEGQVLARAGGGVPAKVTLQATRLSGVPTGVFATFSRSIDTDGEGRFSVAVLPGSYRVRAEPERAESAAGGMTAAEAPWEVPADPPRQAGRVLEVDRVLDVRGRATLTWNALGARGAIAGLEPQRRVTRARVLEGLFDEDATTPRSARTLVDPEGDFVFDADHGRFDLFVRPPGDTNLAWYVMPGVEIESSTHLGSLQLPLPVRLEGEVRFQVYVGPSPFSLAHSLLRAYVPLDAEGRVLDRLEGAQRAVPVAEARLDPRATFVLNVPASLNQASNR